MGQNRPPALMLPTLTVQVHTLVTLARAATLKARPGLLLLASRFAEYTGWMAQEAGDDRAMGWWTRKAVEYGDAIDDAELAAYAYIRHANAAMYRDDGATTIDLARQAAHRADTQASRLQGLARQREAQGHALLGHRDDCLRALDRAREFFDAVPATRPVTTAEPVLGTATVADPSDLALGWCLHDLGHSEEAIAVLERHLARVPGSARRARARAAGRLALAHASVGDPKMACAVADGVLDDAVHLDSATLRHDLSHLARSLSRWRADPDVQLLSHRLSQSLRTPQI
jgi:hypothetical protein